MSDHLDADWVSASEIAAYTYCARAYWLERVQRVERASEVGGRLADGVALHRAHGRRVVWHHRLLRAALLLLVAAALVLAGRAALRFSAGPRSPASPAGP